MSKGKFKYIVLLLVVCVVFCFVVMHFRGKDVNNKIDNVQEYENDISEPHNEVEVADNPTVDENGIYYTVEEMPQFPGGEEELYKWVLQHTTYPSQDDFLGTIIVQFVVQEDGTIGEIKLVRSRHPDFDEEAIRVARSLPRFIPGKHNGLPVKVWYTLPVRFRRQI